MNTDTKYDQRHGGPYDRGSADAWYRRGFRPHYFKGASYNTEEILIEKGTPEYDAYAAGYKDQVDTGERKDWS